MDNAFLQDLVEFSSFQAHFKVIIAKIMKFQQGYDLTKIIEFQLI